MSPLFKMAETVLKFLSENSSNVGVFAKLTTLCCPALPIRLKRMENITEPSGTVTPESVASSHEKVSLPDDTRAVPKLLTPSPGSP